MKFSAILSIAVLAAPALSLPIHWYSKRAADAATVTSLAPDLGFQSGLNPTGTGDCDGAVNGADGNPIKIPCACPPPQDQYIQSLIANVQAGFAVKNPTVKVAFPTDNSPASQSARITAALITLQDLNGAGVGCPAVSTTLQAQQKAIASGGTPAPAPASVIASSAAPPPASASAPAPAASSPAANNVAGALDAATIQSLAPVLGFQSGVNPTGTGDCDGAVNGADGKPIKVPCACPPAQDVYLQSLVANVQAGFAVKNPTVKVAFPTDNSPQSQSARITAALITLQDLNGAGVGCPAVSTTLQAQQKALGV